MKSKLVVGLLVIAILLCQGLAFAEATKDVTAVAEDVVVATDPATGVKEEVFVDEDSVNGVVEDAVVVEELVAPATDVKEEEKEEEKM